MHKLVDKVNQIVHQKQPTSGTYREQLQMTELFKEKGQLLRDCGDKNLDDELTRIEKETSMLAEECPILVPSFGHRGPDEVMQSIY